MKTSETASESSKTKSKAETCPDCSNNHVVRLLQDYGYVYDLGKSVIRLRIKLPVYGCVECQSQWTNWEAEEAKRNALCQHLGILNPTEIRRIRKKYRMSRGSFAQLTGISEASLSRWEKGLKLQNIAHDRYLRLLSYPKIFKRLQRIVVKIEAQRQDFLESNRTNPFTINQTDLKLDEAEFELRDAI